MFENPIFRNPFLKEEKVDIISLPFDDFKKKVKAMSEFEREELLKKLTDKLAFQQRYGNDVQTERYYQRRIDYIESLDF